MKILTVYAHAEIKTGAHRRLHHLTEQLAARGHRVTFVSPLVKEGRNIRHVPLRGRAWRLPRTHKVELVLKTLMGVRRLEQACAGCDVMLVFGVENLLAGLVLNARLGLPLLFSLRGAPLLSAERVQHERGLLSRAHAAAYRCVVAFAMRFADRVVVQTGGDAQNAAQRYGVAPHKLRVIPNNLIKKKRPASNLDARKNSRLKRLLFLGTLSARKGLLPLLDAFARLARREDDVMLDVAGDGPLREAGARFVEKHGLEARVRFLGHVEDPTRLLARSDLLVVPSLFDSFPNVVLEAFAVGTPVIGADTGGITEMLRHGLLLFPPGDPLALAEKLCLLTGGARYEEARRLCRQRKSAYLFDWTGAFEGVLCELVHGVDGSEAQRHAS